MIETLVVYFIFLIHWLELTFGAALSTGIRGVSLGNSALALALMGWLMCIAFKRANFQWNNFYFFILLLVWVVAMSIPYKGLHGEFGRVSTTREILNFITWIQHFVLFVLVFNLAHSKPIVKRITVGLMIYVMLSVVVTILVVTDVWNIGEVRIQRRVMAWPRFAEPNQYAAFLVLMSPLFIGYVLFGKLKYSRIAIALCCSLIFFALIASGSRGGIFSFGVAFITYLFLLKRIGKTGQAGLFIGGAVILVLIAITIVVVPSEVKERTFARLDYTEKEDIDTYSSGRIRIWTDAWQYLSKSPVFGLGQHSYQLISGTDSHNLYLTYLINHGVIGVALFVLLLIGLLKRGLKGLKNAKDNFGIILFSGFFSGMLGFSLAIFFVNIYQLWSIVMIYGALALRYAQLDAQEHSTPKQIHDPALIENFVHSPKEAINK